MAKKQKPVIELRDNRLQDCLDELAKRWEEAFQRKGARLEAEFELSIPTFRFDYQKVQQAAANLLDHALRQALPNETVTLRCLSRSNGAEVSVTGATEHDQKVFDNYRAVLERFLLTRRSGRWDYQESLDLGLNIAQRLVLAHGGKIWVEPSSTGSKFVFVLPMDASLETVERIAQEMEAAGIGAWALGGKKTKWGRALYAMFHGGLGFTRFPKWLSALFDWVGKKEQEGLAKKNHNFS